MAQVTNKVFMVSPIAFCYNEETSLTNTFQKKQENQDTQALALKESNDFVALLKNHGIEVILGKDTALPHTPDSVFPNNWFSTHEDGTLVLYPMLSKNRRLERKEIFLELIKKHTPINRIIDFTEYESLNLFLEGTGSMVLDRDEKIVYASLSPRTSDLLIDRFCEELGYKKIIFHAYDESNSLIYHTNVMMSIGKDYSLICLDSIKDEAEKEKVVDSLKQTNKTIIPITLKQVGLFLGNTLECETKDKKRVIILSNTAYQSLTKEQKDILESKATLLHPSIPTIEQNGGGSARCMIAELF